MEGEVQSACHQETTTQKHTSGMGEEVSKQLNQV